MKTIEAALSDRLMLHKSVISLIGGTSYVSEVMADAPSIFLRLNETSGILAFDSTRNNLIGAYRGSPILGVSGPVAAISVLDNYAVTLDGFQSITVPSNDLLNPGDVFSVEFFFSPTAFLSNTTQSIMAKGAGGMSVTCRGGTIRLEKNGGNLIAHSAASVGAGFRHACITKSGSDTHVYVNGVDVTVLGIDDTIVSTTSPLTIGSDQAMTIADVAIYPTALSATRIAAHYAAVNTLPRIYPLRLEQGVTLPALTYFVVSGDSEFTLAGQQVGLGYKRIQISAWSKNIKQAKSLVEALRTLSGMKTSWGGIRVSVVGFSIGPDLYEEDTQMYQIPCHVLIWHDEPINP